MVKNITNYEKNTFSSNRSDADGLLLWNNKKKHLLLRHMREARRLLQQLPIALINPSSRFVCQVLLSRQSTTKGQSQSR